MSVEEFLSWAQSQDEGSYELVEGKIVMMPPDRALHNRTKLAIARALEDGVSKAGLECIVFTDGIGIRTGADSVRLPDASVQLGSEIDDKAMLLDRPIIVVEVVSPASERDDSGPKFIEYFSVGSIQHYLVVDPWKKIVVHHRRVTPATFESLILSDGELQLTPPGFTVQVNALLGDR